MKTEDPKPKLSSASFKFYQDANCVSGGEIEELTIECESSLGIDEDKEYFYVLKTEQWAVNDENDLKELFDRINKIIIKPKI